MCELCSADAKERDAAASVLRYQAERIRELAKLLEALASRSVKPHGPGMTLGPLSAEVVKICAEYL